MTTPCTFELSPGRNADLTNDCHWWPMTSWKWFLQAFPCWLSVTARYGNSLGYASILPTVWQSWGSNELVISDRMHGIESCTKQGFRDGESKTPLRPPLTHYPPPPPLSGPYWVNGSECHCEGTAEKQTPKGTSEVTLCVGKWWKPLYRCFLKWALYFFLFFWELVF